MSAAGANSCIPTASSIVRQLPPQELPRARRGSPLSRPNGPTRVESSGVAGPLGKGNDNSGSGSCCTSESYTSSGLQCTGSGFAAGCSSISGVHDAAVFSNEGEGCDSSNRSSSSRGSLHAQSDLLQDPQQQQAQQLKGAHEWERQPVLRTKRERQRIASKNYRDRKRLLQLHAALAEVPPEALPFAFLALSRVAAVATAAAQARGHSTAYASLLPTPSQPEQATPLTDVAAPWRWGAELQEQQQQQCGQAPQQPGAKELIPQQQQGESSPWPLQVSQQATHQRQQALAVQHDMQQHQEAGMHQGHSLCVQQWHQQPPAGQQGRLLEQQQYLPGQQGVSAQRVTPQAYSWLSQQQWQQQELQARLLPSYEPTMQVLQQTTQQLQQQIQQPHRGDQQLPQQSQWLPESPMPYAETSTLWQRNFETLSGASLREQMPQQQQNQGSQTSAAAFLLPARSSGPVLGTAVPSSLAAPLSATTRPLLAAQDWGAASPEAGSGNATVTTAAVSAAPTFPDAAGAGAAAVTGGSLPPTFCSGVSAPASSSPASPHCPSHDPPALSASSTFATAAAACSTSSGCAAEQPLPGPPAAATAAPYVVRSVSATVGLTNSSRRAMMFGAGSKLLALAERKAQAAAAAQGDTDGTPAATAAAGDDAAGIWKQQEGPASMERNPLFGPTLPVDLYSDPLGLKKSGNSEGKVSRNSLRRSRCRPIAGTSNIEVLSKFLFDRFRSSNGASAHFSSRSIFNRRPSFLRRSIRKMLDATTSSSKLFSWCNSQFEGRTSSRRSSSGSRRRSFCRCTTSSHLSISSSRTISHDNGSTGLLNYSAEGSNASQHASNSSHTAVSALTNGYSIAPVDDSNLLSNSEDLWNHICDTSYPYGSSSGSTRGSNSIVECSSGTYEEGSRRRRALLAPSFPQDCEVSPLAVTGNNGLAGKAYTVDCSAASPITDAVTLARGVAGCSHAAMSIHPLSGSAQTTPARVVGASGATATAAVEIAAGFEEEPARGAAEEAGPEAERQRMGYDFHSGGRTSLEAPPGVSVESGCGAAAAVVQHSGSETAAEPAVPASQQTTTLVTQGLAKNYVATAEAVAEATSAQEAVAVTGAPATAAVSVTTTLTATTAVGPAAASVVGTPALHAPRLEAAVVADATPVDGAGSGKLGGTLINGGGVGHVEAAPPGGQEAETARKAGIHASEGGTSPLSSFIQPKMCCTPCAFGGERAAMLLPAAAAADDATCLRAAATAAASEYGSHSEPAAALQPPPGAPSSSLAAATPLLIHGARPSSLSAADAVHSVTAHCVAGGVHSAASAPVAANSVNTPLSDGTGASASHDINAPASVAVDALPSLDIQPAPLSIVTANASVATAAAVVPEPVEAPSRQRDMDIAPHATASGAALAPPLHTGPPAAPAAASADIPWPLPDPLYAAAAPSCVAGATGVSNLLAAHGAPPPVAPAFLVAAPEAPLAIGAVSIFPSPVSAESLFQPPDGLGCSPPLSAPAACPPPSPAVTPAAVSSSNGADALPATASLCGNAAVAVVGPLAHTTAMLGGAAGDGDVGRLVNGVGAEMSFPAAACDAVTIFPATPAADVAEDEGGLSSAEAAAAVMGELSSKEEEEPDLFQKGPLGGLDCERASVSACGIGAASSVNEEVSHGEAHSRRSLSKTGPESRGAASLRRKRQRRRRPALCAREAGAPAAEQTPRQAAGEARKDEEAFLYHSAATSEEDGAVYLLAGVEPETQHGTHRNRSARARRCRARAAAAGRHERRRRLRRAINSEDRDSCSSHEEEQRGSFSEAEADDGRGTARRRPGRGGRRAAVAAAPQRPRAEEGTRGGIAAAVARIYRQILLLYTPARQKETDALMWELLGAAAADAAVQQKLLLLQQFEKSHHPGASAAASLIQCPVQQPQQLQSQPLQSQPQLEQRHAPLQQDPSQQHALQQEDVPQQQQYLFVEQRRS